jgi:glutathione synthase
MRIGFVVNAVETEEHVYTTTRLGLAATNRGHEVWFMGVADFTYNVDGSLSARARRTAGSRYQGTKTFLAALQGSAATQEDIVLDDLDVLLLRNDPAGDAVDRPWAQASGILFGQMAVSRGVMVLNDPSSLANATNKTYFQQFPEGVRPATVITRATEEVRAFVKERGRAVIKPLQGSGGQGVFLVDAEDGSNLNQIIEATRRDGYIVVQEYLPQATEGDVRLFVMNGQPLRSEGKVAAFRRYNSSEDIRSNMHAGGKIQRAKVDERMLELVEMVRPKLVQDGMFLVGLDIVGDKLMEVNVFSPGGLGSVQKLEGVDFAKTVIEAIERKVHYRAVYADSPLSNLEVATL